MAKSKDVAATDLAGLRVAITGGTSGLGHALVRVLHRRGARVAFCARDAPTAFTGRFGTTRDARRSSPMSRARRTFIRWRCRSPRYWAALTCS